VHFRACSLCSVGLLCIIVSMLWCSLVSMSLRLVSYFSARAIYARGENYTCVYIYGAFVTVPPLPRRISPDHAPI
jgi:hypothetical protein